MENRVPQVSTKHGFLEYSITDSVSRWRKPKETILFHHGVGINMDIWIDWLPYLSKDFTCVRFDMRGCG